MVGALGTGKQRKNQDYLDHSISSGQLKYWEESWRSEETCCHSDSSERLPTDVGVKNKSITF